MESEERAQTSYERRQRHADRKRLRELKEEERYFVAEHSFKKFVLICLTCVKYYPLSLGFN